MTTAIEAHITELFAFNMDSEIERITNRIRSALRDVLRRRGLVVGLSGGIDSSVCAALAAKAVGPSKVFGLLMPEQDSSSSSVALGKLVAEHLGIEYKIEDIAPTLHSIGCYRWRDEAMRSAFPTYQPHWRSKIAISEAAEAGLSHFRLIVEDEAGERFDARLGVKEYLQIVAATNFKQRIRKTLEFFHADRLNYAVAGTPNRVEYDQGFFVKNGDGAADIKPIAHLYKCQIYMLARHLQLPEPIASSIPSTDTYSLTQGQDEFYFRLPYREMDIALWHHNNSRPARDLAQRLQISDELANVLYRDIEGKRRATASLHWPALLVENINGPMSDPPLP
jgi:NAD+ synthase